MAKRRRPTKRTARPLPATARRRRPRPAQNAGAPAAPLNVRGFTLSDEAVERSLLLGTNRRELEELFGDAYLRHVESLAAEANRARTRGGMRVLILPGILGSTLEVGDDTIWFDPLDIARGKLLQLALKTGASNVCSNGVFLPTYLELKLRLRLAGFRSEFFHFDWRKPIQDAGKLLVEKIERLHDRGDRVALVAHSMGGLVSRAALKLLGARADSLVERTILFGTPNFGSYAPALVLTGNYSTAKWMAFIDRKNSMETLVKDVFSTFIGLCQMLPGPSHAQGVNYFKLSAYPSVGPRPRADVLRDAEGWPQHLIDGSPRITMIAGVGVETVVGLEVKAGKFEFQRSTQGDGTVPLSMAKLPGAMSLFCNAAHGKLPTNNGVIRSVIDLLQSGDTRSLPPQPEAAVPVAAATRATASVHEAGLESLQRGARVPDEITVTEVRHALEPFVAPGEVDRLAPAMRPEAEAVSLAPAMAAGLSSQAIVVGRRRQQRLDLRLAYGDVTQATGRAVLLGIFCDVRPAGAAVAIDQRIGGIIAEVFERRMYAANLGEVFAIPTPRHGMRADLLVLVGLGPFSQFTDQTLRFAVENATRTLLRCQVDELVTIPIGGGTGLEKAAIVRSLLEGLTAALLDAGDRPSLRGLTICENDREAFERLCVEVLALAASSALDGIEVTIERESLPEAVAVLPELARHALAPDPDRCYLISRLVTDPSGRDSATADSVRLDLSLLTSGSKATVLAAEQEIETSALEGLLQKVQQVTDRRSAADFQRLGDLGVEAGELLLPPLIRAALDGLLPSSLTIINDAYCSRIPWEIVGLPEWKFGKEGNVSRRYATGNLSVAKWLHERRADQKLRLLLVVDPTEDLSGAEAEGKRIEKLVREIDHMEVVPLRKRDATRDRIKSELATGEYDVLHYAGHAYFDPEHRSSSGIVCAGENVLSGPELATLESLPSLAVFNACESARVRTARLPSRAASRRRIPARDLVDRNVSFAEAFLRGGIGSYVGTYWPVGDAGAELFAKHFYTTLLAGRSIGAALQKARTELYSDKNLDWANYIYYGDPAFAIKSG